MSDRTDEFRELWYGININTSGQYYNVSKESRPSNASSTCYTGQMSATESSRGDDLHDSSDNESMRG
jgi:hypothetical protein